MRSGGQTPTVPVHLRGSLYTYPSGFLRTKRAAGVVYAGSASSGVDRVWAARCFAARMRSFHSRRNSRPSRLLRAGHRRKSAVIRRSSSPAAPRRSSECPGEIPGSLAGSVSVISGCGVPDPSKEDEYEYKDDQHPAPRWQFTSPLCHRSHCWKSANAEHDSHGVRRRAPATPPHMGAAGGSRRRRLRPIPGVHRAGRALGPRPQR
jgi:hypothetical protein